MTDKIKELPQEVTEDGNIVNRILEEAKGRFKTVLIVGVTDSDDIDIRTNIASLYEMSGLLNEAGFELSLFRKNKRNEA